MAKTLEELEAELAQIDAQLTKGVSSLSYDGRSVTYRSMSELKEARAILEAEIGKLSPTGAKKTTSLATYGRGY